MGDLTLTGPLLLAPIAGYCDLAFRLAIRPLGGIALACTDLVNPRGLLRQTRKSMVLVETEPADRPLCIQLYGREPAEMADAARWCQDHGADVIDINMGCPADKICAHAGGAALLQETPLALAITRAVVRAVRVPVTAKIRLGWDEQSIIAPQLAPQLEDAGVTAITVHGRTAAQRFGGSANWDRMAEVVSAVRTIPVIGNGDVDAPERASAMMRHTGCAGVMIGRAALRDPWIFRDTQAWLDGLEPPPPPSVADRIAFMDRHFEYLLNQRDERIAVLIFRQRVSWYLGRIFQQGCYHARLGPARAEAYRTRIRHISHADEYRRWSAALASDGPP